MRRWFCILALCVGLAGVASCRRAIPPAADREAIAATVNAFHDALAKGDRDAVMSLLAGDAQILETGHAETRAEYESGHLAADIEFAKAVPSTRGAMIVRQEGSVAWVTSTSRTTGQYQSRAIDSESAELMVLTNTPDGWRIRAIHWSSHAHK